MKEINPQNNQDEINVQRTFWVAVIYTVVAISSVGLAFFLISRYQIWQVYVMMVITLFSLGFDVAALIYIRRGRPAFGLKILYWSGLVTVPLNSVLFFGVTAFLIPMILVVGFVNVFYLFPKSWRKYLQFGPIIATLLMLLVDLIDPPFRISLSNASGNFGFIALTFIIISTLVIILRLAWGGNIRVKLSIPSAVAVFAALFVFSYIILQSTKTALTDQVGESFITHAEDHSDQIVNFFLEKVGQLQVLSLSEILRETIDQRNNAYTGSQAEILAEIQTIDQAWVAATNTDPVVVGIISNDPTINPATNSLLDFLNTFPYHAEVFITDRYGATVSATGRLSDYYQADEDWWQAAWNEGEGAIYISEPEFDESLGTTALLIAIPITDHAGEVIGVLRSTLIADTLRTLIAEDTLGESGHAVLFDSAGDVIFDPRADTVNSAGLPIELRQEFITENAHSDISQDQHGTEILFGHAAVYSNLPETSHLSAESEVLIVVNNLGWASLFRQDTSEALSIVISQTRIMIWAAVIINILIIGVLVLLAQILVAPLLRLTTVAEEVAGGDLSARAKIETSDEIGVLATTFNNMTSQLQTTLGSLEQQVADRTRALETSTEVSRRLSTILEQDQLVREVVEQLRSAFGYYHAQIYLYDNAQQNLVMAGGTGDAGRSMLARGHKIEPGRGLVGRAAATNMPVLIPSVERTIGFEIITSDTVEDVFERESSLAATEAWYANTISERFTDIRIFAKRMAQRKASGEQMPRLGYILYGMNDFLATIKTGAEEAAQSLGFELEIVSADLNPDKGIRLFREMIAKKKDGLIVQPTPPKKWVAPIQEAVAAGIPVLTTNVRSPGSASSAWFGQDSYQSGIILARELLKALIAAGKSSGEIVVASAREIQELHERYAGLKRGLQGSAYTVSEFYDVPLSNPEQNYIGWERLVNTHPDMVAAVGLASMDLPSLIRIKKQINAQWVAGGYDLTVEILEAIKDGTAQVTIGQHPYMQGYLPVLALGQYYVDGTPLKDWIVDGWQPNPLLPDTKAEVAIPITMGEDVLGVLDVQHNVAGGLSQQDADLIQSIANQVGIAVRNAQAYERTQRQAVREARITGISQRIQSAATIDDVIKVAVQELGQALGTQRASVELRATEPDNGQK
ncbi:MAG TPA: hypothetical protein DEH25_15765 [Chloroflexi bacterium]|nr:hypothetical protein [Chloroflexota bacterium]